MIVESTHPEQPIGSAIASWKRPSLPPREVMKGRFCKLEPIDVAAHSQSLFSANQMDRQGVNWTYLPYGPFENFEDYRLWMENTCLNDDPLFFAIRDLETDEIVGVASFLGIKPENGSIEIGHLHFSPKLQKTIAATEAMYLIMQRAFDLGYRRYEWKCDALNAPSRVSAQRLGLSFEGVFRQHMVVKGRNRDSAWYAAIDTEWMKLREAFATWLSPENFDESGKQRTRLSELTSPVLWRKG